MGPEIVNTDQAAAWDGEEGQRWVENADRYESSARLHWERFLAREPVTVEDRVLDVGCGNGSSSRDVARVASKGSVLGVDLSTAMLALARQRAEAEGLTNVRFEHADAQAHDFEGSAFDVVISRYGSMFFSDPVAAFRNIRRALVPEGRMSLLVWRDITRNEWIREMFATLAFGRTFPDPLPGVPGPMSLADEGYTRKVLESAGFADVDFESVEAPMIFGADADDAFSFVRTMGVVKGLTQDFDEGRKAEALDLVHGMLARHETSQGVAFEAATWIITARAN